MTGQGATREVGDRLVLSGYVRDVEIGAFQPERGAVQKVRFSITLDTTPPERGLDDEVDGILSYDRLVEAIDASLLERRYDLLETLAERIAQRVLAHPRALRITVRIEKLDLGPYVLGVEITRIQTVPTLVRPATDGIEPWILVQPPPEASQGWVDGVGQIDEPVVLVPRPLADRPQGYHATAQTRIDLLSQDQAAWHLGSQFPGAGVAESRTEIEAVLRAGDVAIWAPARMILRRAGSGADVLNDPAAQAIWLATLFGVDGRAVVPSGIELSLVLVDTT
ncbi:MAG: dihydroneopterin aldolase [Pseudomonadota bacterium]